MMMMILEGAGNDVVVGSKGVSVMPVLFGPSGSLRMKDTVCDK